MIAFFGEFVGTTMFIFLGLGCIKTAQDSTPASQTETVTTLGTQAIMFISAGMGLSLLVTAWVFYRITGGLFNPAVTLALYLIGALNAIRAILLTIAQIAGGIAGAGLVAALTPTGGVGNAITVLQPGMSYVKGVFLEAFLTAMLVFTILMLAAEKHKATYLAPLGIGLALFACQLFGTLWTGCGMNPARALGPSVISNRYPGYHWIYWVGPIVGSLIATFFYSILKAFDYGSVVLGQDADHEGAAQTQTVASRVWNYAYHGRLTKGQKQAMRDTGLTHADVEKAEKGLMAHAAAQNAQAGVGQPANGIQGRPSDATTLAEAVPMYATSGSQASMPASGRSPMANQPVAVGLMQAGAQNHGGVGTPGGPSGLGNIVLFNKIVTHGAAGNRGAHA